MIEAKTTEHVFQSQLLGCGLVFHDPYFSYNSTFDVSTIIAHISGVNIDVSDGAYTSLSLSYAQEKPARNSSSQIPAENNEVHGILISQVSYAAALFANFV